MKYIRSKNKEHNSETCNIHLIMAQLQKVGTKVYGNTPHDVYQRPYNPVAHESSVKLSPTNIWYAPSTSPLYNSSLLLFWT